MEIDVWLLLKITVLTKIMETFGAIQDICTLDWIYHVQWPKQNKRYDLRFYWRIQPLVLDFKF